MSGEVKDNILYLYVIYISVSQEAGTFYGSTKEFRKVLLPHHDVTVVS